MKIDLHCHTKYSQDNFLEPQTLISAALARGLDGVCITEHDSFEASSPIELLEDVSDFLVLRGVEISTDVGHILAFGIKDDTWSRWPQRKYLPVYDILDSVHDQGGICVPAHPFRGYDSIGLSARSVGGFDAIETHNGRDTADQTRKAIKLAEELDLPGIGGSDCHHKQEVGRAYTVFDGQIRSIEDLVSAIKSGDCYGVRPD